VGKGVLFIKKKKKKKIYIYIWSQHFEFPKKSVYPPLQRKIPTL